MSQIYPLWEGNHKNMYLSVASYFSQKIDPLLFDHVFDFIVSLSFNM